MPGPNGHVVCVQWSGVIKQLKRFSLKFSGAAFLAFRLELFPVLFCVLFTYLHNLCVPQSRHFVKAHVCNAANLLLRTAAEGHTFKPDESLVGMCDKLVQLWPALVG
jgi:hypothetical protein